jgi:hypothetical protein
VTRKRKDDNQPLAPAAGVCPLCRAPGVADLIGNDGLKPCGSTFECLELQKKKRLELEHILDSVGKFEIPNEDVERHGKPLAPSDKDSVFSTGKAKRSASLEQATVAVLIAPADPDAPWSRDLETDLPIKPPMLGVIEKGQKLPVGPRCDEHPDYPAAECYKCREEADHQRARDLAAAAPKIELPSPEKPVDAPKLAEAEQLERNLRASFGLDKKAAPSPRPPVIREIHLRKIFGVKLEQIVEWLSDLRILYLCEPTKVIVCNKESVMREPDNTEFDRLQTEKIVGLEKDIAEQEKMLEELKQRQGDNGLTRRENTTLRKRYVNAIKNLKHEITQAKRQKPPHMEPQQAEVDKPGTEHEELRFTGQRLDPMWVDGYLKSFADMTVGGGWDFLVENAVICRAIDAGMYTHPFLQEYKAKYWPAFTIAEQVLDHGEHEILAREAGVEYAEHAESDAHSSALSFHGEGIRSRGYTYRQKPLKTFDNFRRVTGGSGRDDDGGARHSGAPDYDPSDDTN